jgi:DNA-binding response OmpR family regulator
MVLEFARAMRQHVHAMYSGHNAGAHASSAELLNAVPAAMVSPAHEAPRLLLMVGAEGRAPQPWLDQFARSGWRCIGAASPNAAALAARVVKVDLVLLRSASPPGSLLDALQALCQSFRCPVLVLAEAADPFDEVLALEAGACAYLAEPIEPRRLRAHLSVWLREARATVVDPGPAPAALLGPPGMPAEPVLASGLKRLFLALRRAAGQPVNRESLTAAMSGLALPEGAKAQRSRALDTRICRLRKALQQQQPHWRLRAVRGEGYCLSWRGR